MHILIGILTSNKLDKLERCLKSAYQQATPSDIVVIINSPNDDYVKKAEKLCKKYYVKTVVTESNGKPGKGKNSVIQYFLSTDYEYLLPVDGDDFLLPNALSILSNVANKNDIDVLGLIDCLALHKNRYLTVEEWLRDSEYLSRVVKNISQSNLRKFNLHIERIRRTSTEHGNFFNRFVLISRKAAEYIVYDEDMGGAEDVRQGLLLKLLHHQEKLKYLLLSNKDVYIHDVSDEGVFFQVLCKCDPSTEKELFWKNLGNDEIEILRSFQLDKTYG